MTTDTRPPYALTPAQRAIVQRARWGLLRVSYESYAPGTESDSVRYYSREVDVRITGLKGERRGSARKDSVEKLIREGLLSRPFRASTVRVTEAGRCALEGRPVPVPVAVPEPAPVAPPVAPVAESTDEQPEERTAAQWNGLQRAAEKAVAEEKGHQPRRTPYESTDIRESFTSEDGGLSFLLFRLADDCTSPELKEEHKKKRDEIAKKIELRNAQTLKPKKWKPFGKGKVTLKKRTAPKTDRTPADVLKTWAGEVIHDVKCNRCHEFDCLCRNVVAAILANVGGPVVDAEAVEYGRALIAGTTEITDAGHCANQIALGEDVPEVVAVDVAPGDPLFAVYPTLVGPLPVSREQEITELEPGYERVVQFGQEWRVRTEGKRVTAVYHVWYGWKHACDITREHALNTVVHIGSFVEVSRSSVLLGLHAESPVRCDQCEPGWAWGRGKKPKGRLMVGGQEAAVCLGGFHSSWVGIIPKEYTDGLDPDQEQENAAAYAAWVGGTGEKPETAEELKARKSPVTRELDGETFVAKWEKRQWVIRYNRHAIQVGATLAEAFDRLETGLRKSPAAYAEEMAEHAPKGRRKPAPAETNEQIEDQTVGRGSMAPKARATAVKVGDIEFTGDKGRERAVILGHSYRVGMLAGDFEVEHLATGDRLTFEGEDPKGRCQSGGIYFPNRPAIKRAILADALSRGAAEEQAEPEEPAVETTVENLPRPLRLALEREALADLMEDDEDAHDPFAPVPDVPLSLRAHTSEAVKRFPELAPFMKPRTKEDPLLVLNLFSGPGGMVMGLRDVLRQKTGRDVDIINIDNDPDCVATLIAAGEVAICADVTSLSPADPVFREVKGLIVTAPCTDYADSGLRAGRRADNIDILSDAWDSARRAAGMIPFGDMGDHPDFGKNVAMKLPNGFTWDDVRGDLEDYTGQTGHLMLELPIWTMGLRAAGADLEWVAVEQSSRLPEELRGEAVADFQLMGWGMAEWNIVDAADFGSPTQRVRSLLVARRDGHTGVTLEAPMVRTGAAAATGLPEGTKVFTRGVGKRSGGGNVVLVSDSKPYTAFTSRIRSVDVEEKGGRFEIPQILSLIAVPAHWPFQGSRTSICQQVADIVVPVVAAALLGAAMGIQWWPHLAAYLAERYPTIHGGAEVSDQGPAGFEGEADSGLADTDEKPGGTWVERDGRRIWYVDRPGNAIQERFGTDWEPLEVFTAPEVEDHQDEPQPVPELTNAQREAARRIAREAGSPGPNFLAQLEAGHRLRIHSPRSPVRLSLPSAPRTPVDLPAVPLMLEAGPVCAELPTPVAVEPVVEEPQRPDTGRRYWETASRVTLDQRAGQILTSRTGKGVLVLWDDDPRGSGSWAEPEVLWVEGTEPREWFAAKVAPAPLVEVDGTDYAALSRTSPVPVVEELDAPALTWEQVAAGLAELWEDIAPEPQQQPEEVEEFAAVWARITWEATVERTFEEIVADIQTARVEVAGPRVVQVPIRTGVPVRLVRESMTVAASMALVTLVAASLAEVVAPVAV